MSVQYTCDGCDKTIGISCATTRIRVSVSGESVKDSEYHLCPSCRQHLHDTTDPEKWLRVAK
jgi:predicted  nucleic acid-binding Zn ribbon protein